MNTSGGPARGIQLVLAIVIGALAVMGGLGLVTISDDGAAPTPAATGGTAPTAPAAGATPFSADPGGATSRTSATEAPLGPDRHDTRKLIVFMQPVATQADIDAVRKTLEAMGEVRSIRFVDHAEGHAEMKVLFADQPELIQAIDVEDVPVNFHVLPRPNVDRHVIGARLSGHDQVLNIVYPGE